MSHEVQYVEATVGVQGDDGKVEACPVRLTKCLTSTADTVRAFTFDQFTIHTTEATPATNKQHWKDTSDYGQAMSLSVWMHRVKPCIEAEDSNDEDDFYSLSDQTLIDLHDVFIPIVRQVVLQYQFYASGLQDYNLERLQIKKYAKPNYRKAPDQYAQYLHNDAWIAADDTTHGEVPPAVAMVNVWFVLNEKPPSNTLVFWETNGIHTVRATHMLHAHPVHTRHQIVVYDGDMAWGRFYVFVAGQRQDTTAKLLLHGALCLPNHDDEGAVDADSKDDAIRRSVEMRYMLHAPKA